MTGDTRVPLRTDDAVAGSPPNNRHVRRLLRLAVPVAPRLVLAVVFGVLAAASAVGLTATSAWLISRAAQHPPVVDLAVAIVMVRTFAITRGAFRYLERLTGHDAAFRVLGRLRVATYQRLERLAPAAVAVLRAGDLVSRFVADVDAALDVLVRVVLPYLVAAGVGVASVGLIATMLPAEAAVLAVGLLLVAVGVPLIQHAVARRHDRRTAPLRGELSAATVDLLRGLPDLIAYRAAERRLAALADTDDRLRRVTSRSAAGVGLGAGLVALAAGGCVWAGLALGGAAVSAGHLNGVLLAVVVLTPLAVFDTVSGVPAAAAHLAAARAALGRVFGLLDQPDPVREPERPVPPPTAPYLVEIAGVSARWTPDGRDVLHDVTLTLRPGQRTAIVGPSGSGKSTLAAILVRFLDPSAGRVLINGVDATTVAGDDVRQIIGLLGEDARLFDTTIAENLRIADPAAGDSRLRQALADARLLDWVDALPEGLDTPVGEHGSRLSGGQRRRLVLARALLADFPILIMDEPTEHLDEETAEALTADLLAATRGRTTVLITHRLFAPGDVDQIVSVDSGRVTITATAPAGERTSPIRPSISSSIP
jgi:thiol reductant ABC exporter CydC subunit